MYCSRCGKKILESMLFCPFCGSEIIIPEQDDATPVPASEPTTPSFDDRTFLWNGSGEEEPETKSAEEAKPETVDVSPIESEKADIPPLSEPQPRQGMARPLMGEPEGVKKPNEVFKTSENDKPLDIFLEREVEEPQDDFDAFEAAQARRGARRRVADGDDDSDDEEREGFFRRHIRELITLILLLALAAGLVVFAMSESGQRTLARLDVVLPIKAEIYSKLGFEAYQAKDYGQSGAYYERALAREPDSFDFASSAAMAYIAHGNTEKATEMLKKCIELRPDAVEPYIYLMRLYPDAAQRPQEVSRLLESGFKRTGDPRLKPLETQEPGYIDLQ